MRNQIRIIVNSMLDYASNKITKEEILDRLYLKTIVNSKASAPAEGLYLSNIIYKDEVFKLHKEFDSKLEREYIESKQFQLIK